MDIVITTFAGAFQFFQELDYWKLTTVVFAAFGVYLAYQQNRLGREKFKLDLFEKRFTVFAGTRTLLTEIMIAGTVKDLKPLWAYGAAIGEASFLFNDEVTEYLEEIYKRATVLYTHANIMDPLPVGDERSRLATLMSEDLTWLKDQLPELKNRFAPYMKFTVWR
jgi:hypothetical protein